MQIWMRCMTFTEVMAMLFHEIYGYYYRTVAEILDSAVKGDLNDGRLSEIVA